MPHPKYPHIFSLLEIGRQRLKNRIIMGSMHSGLEDLPNAAGRLSAYFVERVKGGVGMIITGGITPHESGGKGLGKTTGWTHRISLQRRGVQMLAGVEYRMIDDAGLHITIDDNPRVLDVDTVILCVGQEPQRDLYNALRTNGVGAHLIGGAFDASELDAKRAIKQATELAVLI